MKKRIPSFLAGAATALALAVLATSALAASGQVSFNFANVALNGETKIAAGSTVTVANGQQVPSSILYTDAVGGKTGYTSAAGYCFVCAAERDGVELIAVIFKSGSTGTNRWTDAGRMFDYGFALKGV